MRARIARLLSATLLVFATAVTAQPLPCASIAAEVRDRVREAGACTDATRDDRIPTAASPASLDTVTVTLSDGTVVRVPRELNPGVNDRRKRAASNGTAARKGVARSPAPPQSLPDVPRDSVPAPQFNVPDVIGRSYADAAGALAEFKIDRIETASAAPSGEVIAQEPAPATSMLPGSTVSLQVSDGSLATVADIAPVAETATATAPAPASAPTVAPTSASDPTVVPSRGERLSIAFSLDTALILGVGMLVGLLLGALLMYQWLGGKQAGSKADASLTPSSDRTVEKFSVGVTSETEAPEIRFAARLVPVETTIAFPLLPDADEVVTEHSSHHYA